MNEFKTYVENQNQQLDEILEMTETFIKVAPPGSLRIAQKNPNQYYWVTESTGSKGKYIRKSDVAIAKQLAQKDYAMKLHAKVVQMKKELDEHSDLYDESEIVKFHESFSEARRKLIEPYVRNAEEFAQHWVRIKLDEKERLAILNASSGNTSKLHFGGGMSYPINEQNGIATERGEVVRSKTEKILADKLYMYGIPYVYEMPLYIVGYGYLCPDFTVLNKRTRQEYYWEHFGMMEKAEYCEKAIKKINTYEKQHIYQGRQLLLTFETSTQLPNFKQVEAFIQEFLL